MTNEEMYHLIDMLTMRITEILMNKNNYRLLSLEDKKEAILFDKEIIRKLQEKIDG